MAVDHRIYIMTPEQRAEDEVAETDPVQYLVGGTRDDGSDYYWYRNANIAKTAVTALLQAVERQRKADKVAAEARSFMDAAAHGRSLADADDYRDACREAILARLDWAAYFVGRKHLRHDTWPVELEGLIDVVRQVAIAEPNTNTLERWLMICERMKDDWADQLMRATGVIA